MPWVLILQLIMLTLWYTVAPTLPVWVVFLPSAITLAILAGLVALGCVALVAKVLSD